MDYLDATRPTKSPSVAARHTPKEKRTMQREDPRPRGPVLRTYRIRFRPRSSPHVAWSIATVEAPDRDAAHEYLKSLSGIELHIHSIQEEN